jgi:tetratricopeptide (TPR) repeat protein
MSNFATGQLGNLGQLGSRDPLSPSVDIHARTGADGALAGSVRDANNQWVRDARIELRPLRASEIVASAFTGADGQFLIDHLAFGKYELLVTWGVMQERQEVAVDSASTEILIRLHERVGNQQAGSRSTVSVAEMMAPKKARQYLEKAVKAMREQKLSTAFEETEAALAVYPKYAQALAMRGILKMSRDQMGEALNDLQDAITIDPGYAMAYAAIGSSYNALGRYDDAARSLERAEELEPRSWQAHFEMGKAELGRQNYPAALREVNRALELALPSFPPLHLVRARIYLKQQNYEEAIPDLEEYLRTAPHDATADDTRKTLDQVRLLVAAKR